jgi:hypothetical protein
VLKKSKLTSEPFDAISSAAVLSSSIISFQLSDNCSRHNSFFKSENREGKGSDVSPDREEKTSAMEPSAFGMRELVAFIVANNLRLGRKKRKLENDQHIAFGGSCIKWTRK